MGRKTLVKSGVGRVLNKHVQRYTIKSHKGLVDDK